jgi:FSR family fosmidomycin resistance protein-like MFS transporter
MPSLSPPASTATAAPFAVAVLAAAATAHLLNDLSQSLLVSSYPQLKADFALTFGELGLISLMYNLMSSVLQPLVGMATDRWPQPYALCVGMACTASGMLTLGLAQGMPGLMTGACLVGTGSAVFHPEASRLARLASGGRYGMAQSVFQVGGNLGSALGPLATLAVILPHGFRAIGFFAIVPAAAIVLLIPVGRWYRRHLVERLQRRNAGGTVAQSHLTPRRIALALGVLGLLVFSKYVYLASMVNFYTFILMERFQLTPEAAQWRLFAFLAATAVGTVLGGPVGDRYGRRRVIWVSILGVAPFTLLLPWVGLTATTALSVVIGLVLASAFSAILVYAQELLPGRVGLVSGLFFGFAFGIAGIAAAVLGVVADHYGLRVVAVVCSFLPLLGLLTVLLPQLEEDQQR